MLTCFSHRDFIEDGAVAFAKKNPGTVVYVSPQSCRIPKIVAEYRKYALIIAYKK